VYKEGLIQVGFLHSAEPSPPLFWSLTQPFLLPEEVKKSSSTMEKQRLGQKVF